MVTLQLTATLKDIDGNPLANKPINFYYSYDQQTWNLIATVNTDENGIATTTHETTQTTYYKAVFEGDDVYEPSEATASYTLEAHFTITSYPETINTHPNYTIGFNVTVLNDGNADGTCEVRLKDHNNNIVDSKQVAIAQGAEETVALQATAPSSVGTYTWTIEAYNVDTQTVDDSKSITVNVTEVSYYRKRILAVMWNNTLQLHELE